MTISTDYHMNSYNDSLENRPCSPDIMLGAYLMNHIRPICENCGTHTTPQWRKGWRSEVLNRPVLLCNKCGLKYHKNQFCPYCHYVYGKETDKSPNTWFTCGSCARWCHVECELKYGKHNAFHNGRYMCPGCQAKSSSSSIIAPSHDMEF